MAVGVLAMSSASIFIRLALADGAQPAVIAAYRLSIATLVLSVPAVRQRAWLCYAKLERRELIVLLGSGAFLALHFAAWVTSLAHTSVLSSVVLVTTTPLWIGLASPLVLKEHSSGQMWVGLLAAMVGGMVIGMADITTTSSSASWGDGLALAGALFGAGYLIIGRGFRAQLPFVAYVWSVYGIAAIILIVWAISSGLPALGFAPTTYVWLVALGLVPQLVGHSAANYVIRHVSATLVGISVLGEPIGSTFLAAILLNEKPGLLQLVGAAVILAGISVASLMGNTPPAVVDESMAAKSA
jgi:drug/metabolite transporter (DMT)-like permease